MVTKTRDLFLAVVLISAVASARNRSEKRRTPKIRKYSKNHFWGVVKPNHLCINCLFSINAPNCIVSNLTFCTSVLSKR